MFILPDRIHTVVFTQTGHPVFENHVHNTPFIRDTNFQYYLWTVNNIEPDDFLKGLLNANRFEAANYYARVLVLVRHGGYYLHSNIKMLKHLRPFTAYVNSKVGGLLFANEPPEYTGFEYLTMDVIISPSLDALNFGSTTKVFDWLDNYLKFFRFAFERNKDRPDSFFGPRLFTTYFEDISNQTFSNRRKYNLVRVDKPTRVTGGRCLSWKYLHGNDYTEQHRFFDRSGPTIF